MIKLGIAGGIGSGKTTICNVLQTLGFPVYYADTEAKALMNTDDEIRSQLCEWFGAALYASGSLDRAMLASYIFTDPDALKKVNALVHPKVGKHFADWCDAQDSPCVVKEAAILFESGSYKEMDYTLTVNAPEAIRLQRVMLRDGVSTTDVKDRMSKQWTDEQRTAAADFAIVNDGKSLVMPQLLKILTDLNLINEAV